MPEGKKLKSLNSLSWNYFLLRKLPLLSMPSRSSENSTVAHFNITMNLSLLVSRKKEDHFLLIFSGMCLCWTWNFHLWLKAHSGVTVSLSWKCNFILDDTVKDIEITPWASKLLTIFAKLLKRHAKSINLQSHSHWGITGDDAGHSEKVLNQADYSIPKVFPRKRLYSSLTTFHIKILEKSKS